MRRTSRIALASAASLSVFGWLLAAGCSSSNNTVNNHSADASDDTSTGDDTMVDSSMGDDTMVDSSMGMTGDDDATMAEDSGHGETDSGLHDASTDAHEDGGDASDSGIHDAATDAHDASDAGDADAGDAAATKVPYRLIGRWDESGTGTAANTARADWPGSGFDVEFTGSTLSTNISDQQRTFDPGSCMAAGACVGDYLDVSLYSVSTTGVQTQVSLACTNVTGASTGTCTATTPANSPANTATSVHFGLTSTALGSAGTLLITAPVGTSGTTTAPLLLKVSKATDSTAGTITLNATNTSPFTAGVTSAVIPAAYTFAHKIEFIGDDQTAGDGNIGVCNTAGQGNTAPTTATSDEGASASALVASYFNAEHTTIAMSNAGIGVDGQGNMTLLMGGAAGLFTKTLPGASPSETWTFTNYQPDVVVVNVGGISDAYAIAPAATETQAAFEAAYAAFLSQVHVAYPNAFILVTSGPSVGGNDSQAMWATISTAAITQAKALAMNPVPAANIDPAAYDLSTVNNGIAFGCYYRPSANDYANIAAGIESRIATDLPNGGWTH